MAERILQRVKDRKIVEAPEGGYAEQRLSQVTSEAITRELNLGSVSFRLKETPEDKPGDFGLHMASLAKPLGKKPDELARYLQTKLENNSRSSIIKKAIAEGPYLNIEVNMAVYGNTVVNEVLGMGKDYGKENLGKGRVVVIDTSSPNIAKEMSFGHLRSTIIGEAIAKIYESLGYAEITDNHLGDWGTQFGKQIAALKRWSSEEKIRSADNPVSVLQKLYVDFETLIFSEKFEALVSEIEDKEEESIAKIDGIGGRARLEEIVNAIDDPEIKTVDKAFENIKKKYPDLENGFKALEKHIESMHSEAEVEGRGWFLRLEQGNAEARRIWKMCVDLSIKEFQSVYDILKIDFDLVLGESFYESMLKDTVEFARKSPYVRESEGALIYDFPKLDKKGKPTEEREIIPILTSDGRTLYITRDLATAKFRQDTLKATEILYVVGADQSDYFRPFFRILSASNMPIADKVVHVDFGMVTLPEGKMSTRKGRVVLLKNVIAEVTKRSRETFESLIEKNDELRKKIESGSIDPEEIVRKIAIGALIWNDLSQGPTNGIVFSWDEAVRLDGDSSAYVQYAAVRAKGILDKAGTSFEDVKKDSSGEVVDGSYEKVSEKNLIKILTKYNKALRDAQKDKDPSKVATLVYNVAKSFGSFYENVNVNATEDFQIKNSRLRLVAATYQVIENALNILGIEVPEAM